MDVSTDKAMFKKPPLVLTHANCLDGHAAAYVVRHYFRSHDVREWYEPEVVSCHYGQSPPSQAKVKGRMVVMVDFSYPSDELLALATAAAGLVVLDHHRTARKALETLPPIIKRPDGTSYVPCVQFDEARSGVGLAWDHYFVGIERPWFVNYVEDGDLWAWRLPRSKAVKAGLSSHPYDFDAWDKLPLFDRDGWLAMAKDGTPILRYREQIVDQAVRNANEVTVLGRSVKVVNATCLFSDIAGTLAEGRPFGVAWFKRQDGKYQWSLRSRNAAGGKEGGGEDVSEIAKHFGGGGHVRAAGFETDTLEEVIGT